MRNIPAIFLLVFCFSTAAAQDSLSAYSHFFGNYSASKGHHFSIGRSEQEVFFMDYQSLLYRRLILNGANTFSIENSNGHINFNDKGDFVYSENGKTENAKLSEQPDTEDFLIESNNEKLGGTLWKPTRKRFPVIILVQGAGYETRYGMRYLPYFFNSLGYGVVTYDKRGCGVSTGNYEPWVTGIRTLAGDVIKIYQHLQKRQDVLPAGISMMGISNGAWVITNAAARLPYVDFIIPVAGSFVPIYKQELYRMHEAAVAAGLNKAVIADLDSTMAHLYSEAVLGARINDAEPVKAILQHAANKRWLPFTPLKDFMSMPPQTFYELAKAAWFNELSYDPVFDMKNIIRPVHSITAEQDKISPTAQINTVLAEMQKSFPKMDHVVIPKTGHYMKDEKTGKIPALYLATLRKILLAEK